MIGITLGDACGVGPEILVRSHAGGHMPADAVVFGDRPAIDLAAGMLGIRAEIHVLAEGDPPRSGAINLVDLGLLRRDEITIGSVSAACGSAAVEAVGRATRAALAGWIDSIVTLPLNKEASRLLHPRFEGHTEYIADLCGAHDVTMMLASPKMIVTHVSTHVPLREAIDRVTTERVLDVIRLTAPAAFALRGSARIAVAGLNPHAGEHRAFGDEDEDAIRPAVLAARAEGIDASGPHPPDTLFMKLAAGAHDAAVCMYHDQGHIPMKLHGFADAVNVTLGLPIVRTSVDHGTAFDIAYQGKASLENFRSAIDMALRLVALGRS